MKVRIQSAKPTLVPSHPGEGYAQVACLQEAIQKQTSVIYLSAPNPHWIANFLQDNVLPALQNDFAERLVVLGAEQPEGVMNALNEALAALFPEIITGSGLEQLSSPGLPMVITFMRYRESKRPRVLVIENANMLLRCCRDERVEFCDTIDHLARLNGVAVAVGVSGKARAALESSFDNGKYCCIEVPAYVKQDEYEDGIEVLSGAEKPVDWKDLSLAAPLLGAFCALIVGVWIMLQRPEDTLPPHTLHPVSGLKPEADDAPVLDGQSNRVEDSATPETTPAPAKVGSPEIIEPAEPDDEFDQWGHQWMLDTTRSQTDHWLSAPVVGAAAPELPPELTMAGIDLKAPIPDITLLSTEIADGPPLTNPEVDRTMMFHLVSPESVRMSETERLRKASFIALLQAIENHRELGDHALSAAMGEIVAIVARQLAQFGKRHFVPGTDTELALARAYASAEVADMSSAVRWFRSASNRNIAEASMEYGYHLLTGKGVRRNYSLAFYHVLRAAEAGNGSGAYLAGVCYLNGLGVEADDGLALEQFEAASEMGCSEAFFEAGMMYELGRGAEPNLDWAFLLYRKGARAGDKFCMEKCARFYRMSGLGMKNSSEARRWQKAAEQAPEPGRLRQIAAELETTD